MSTEFQLFPEFGDLFGKEAETYAMSLARRFGEVKVLGMQRPVRLLSLYVRANILEKITSRIGANVEEMEKAFDFDRRPFGKRRETKDGEEIVNQEERFIVLGKPGAGKTTFLKYLTLSILHAETKIQKRRLPIFITLRDWADRRISLMDYITHQFDINGFEQARPYIERALKSGKCLVLFDGLDEVSQEANIDGIIRDILDFTEKYSANQFIISCRIAAYNNSFDRFTDVEIADFNEKQIETFVKNWFSDDTDRAVKCLGALKANPQYQGLASVPLLLTLLCLTYGNNEAFPKQRASLYQKAIEELLEQWDEKRPGGRVKRDEIYKNLSRENKEALLARIAYGTFLENQYFIREDHLAKMIQNFIKNLPQYQDDKILPDGAHVLKQIEAQHGILVERAKGIYSFAHLTFQEYFTARYIVHIGYPEVEKLVEAHLYDDKWKEVFLLVSGMLYNARELLMLLLKKNRELLTMPHLNNLMEEIGNLRLPEYSKFPAEVKKVMAIFLILRHMRNSARDRDSARTRDSALVSDLVSDANLFLGFQLTINRAGDLAISLARDLAHGLELPPASSLDFNHSVASSFDFDHSIESTQTVQEISLFIAGNLLITQCLNSATDLSKFTREYVLKMMFEPLTYEEKNAMQS